MVSEIFSGPALLSIPRSPLVQVPAPPVLAPRGIVPVNELILAVREDNFIDPARTVTRPFYLGDRVSPPFRRGPGDSVGFGGFILGFPPASGGAIILWSPKFTTRRAGTPEMGKGS